MNTADQRSNRRVVLDTYLNKVFRGVRHMVRANNISESGILVHRLIEPDHLGQECDLEFRLDDDDKETIWARARVTRDVNADQFALQFIAMSERHRELVRKYVLSHADWRDELREGSLESRRPHRPSVEPDGFAIDVELPVS
jgi:hypothetical protein